jgi:hypothetical protein
MPAKAPPAKAALCRWCVHQGGDMHAAAQVALVWENKKMSPLPVKALPAKALPVKALVHLARTLCFAHSCTFFIFM